MAVKYQHRIVFVGRQTQDPWWQAVDIYTSRLKNQHPIELVRLKEDGRGQEMQNYLKRLKGPAFVAVLDERGKNPTTEQFAKRMGAALQNQAIIHWLVGPADGHEPDTRNQADWVVSLSAMTLPHRAAIAFLSEQIYRAHTVLDGHPYHRS